MKQDRAALEDRDVSIGQPRHLAEGLVRELLGALTTKWRALDAIGQPSLLQRPTNAYVAHIATRRRGDPIEGGEGQVCQIVANPRRRLDPDVHRPWRFPFFGLSLVFQLFVLSSIKLEDVLAGERLLEPVEKLGGGIDLIVMLAIGKDDHLVEVFGEPGRILRDIDKSVFDHRGLRVAAGLRKDHADATTPPKS